MNKSISNDHNILFGFLLAIIFTLPWFHGGEVNWQFNFFQIIIFITLSILVLTYRTDNTIHKDLVIINKVKIPLLLLIALVLLTFLQTLNLPLNLIELLSPNIAQYYKDTTQVLEGSETVASLSISKSDTFQEGLKQASYICIFVLTLILVNTRKKAVLLITFIFATAVLTAIHAIINYHTNGSFFYIETLPPWQGSHYKTIHGPLSYKNHYASFLILTIPLGISLLFYKKPEKTKKITLQLFNFILSQHSIILAICAFMLAVLIFNTSRAGLLAFTVSIFFTYALTYTRNSKKIVLKKIILTAISVLTVISLILISGLSDRLLERASKYGENGRDTLRETTTIMIGNHWLLGTGAGTFPIIQHEYKSELLNGNKMWQHAHNDYLEALSNQGIIGAGLLGVAIFLLLYKLIASIRSNKSSTRNIQIGCLCSVLSILIHSFADFNFQLPVNTVYFYIILAIGLKAPLLKSRKRQVE